jgi:FkbM family methyltransferase
MLKKIKKRVKKILLPEKKGWIIKTTTSAKLKMLLNLDSYLDYVLYKNNEYELETLICIDKVIKKTDGQIWFIDVGSNIGLMSLYVNKKYPEIKVDAFEPVTINFSQNFLNKEMNRLNYDLHKLILGSKLSDKEKIYLNDKVADTEYNKMNYGMSSIYTNSFHSGGNYETCQMTTFDRFIEENKRNQLINESKLIFKIDVEGAEINVLKGMSELLNSKKEIVFVMELLFEDCYEKCMEVIRFIGLFSFKLFDLRGSLIKENDFKELKDGNYIFSKENTFI